jgi:hypothetical protein
VYTGIDSYEGKKNRKGERMKKQKVPKEIPAQVFIDPETDAVLVKTADNRTIKGRIRIRPVMCGKKCKGCPHKIYKYAVWRDGKRLKEKYIGVVNHAQEKGL